LVTDRQLAALCDTLDLDTPLTRPRLVSAGPPHRVWRLEVEGGVLAVKELDRAQLARPGARHALRQAQSIAAQLAAEGIPTVLALTAEGDPLIDLDGATVLVFPWVDGATLTPGALDLAQAAQLGEVLGRLHAIDLTVPGLERPGLRHFPPEHWLALTRRALALQLEWAGPVREALEAVLALGDRYEAAGVELLRELVVSHRRLTPEHVLWIESAFPWLIDWEAAGYINPAMELAETALRWAGVEQGVPQLAPVQAMLDGYRLAGPELATSASAALAGCAGSRLSELERAMLRSLDANLPANERALALAEVTVALGVIEKLAAHFDDWVAWFEPLP
jgi:Ser/Thr protein kinase RdoA (MazF antagonist)